MSAGTNSETGRLCRIVLPMLLCLAMLLTGCGSRIIFATSYPKDELFLMEDKEAAGNDYRIYLGSLIGETVRDWSADILEQSPVILEDLRKEALERLEKVKALCVYADRQGIRLSREEEQAAAGAAAAYYEKAGTELIGICGSAGTRTPDEAVLTEMFRELLLASKAEASIMHVSDTEISDDEARVVRTLQCFVPSTQDGAQDGAEAALQSAREAAAVMTSDEVISLPFADRPDRIRQMIADRCPDAEVTYQEFARADLDAETELLLFELADGGSSGIVRLEDGYYAWYCISAYDEQLCEENREKIAADRRDRVYEEAVAALTSELAFSFDRKKYFELMQEELPVLSYSIFEELESIPAAE